MAVDQFGQEPLPERRVAGKHLAGQHSGAEPGHILRGHHGDAHVWEKDGTAKRKKMPKKPSRTSHTVAGTLGPGVQDPDNDGDVQRRRHQRLREIGGVVAAFQDNHGARGMVDQPGSLYRPRRRLSKSGAEHTHTKRTMRTAGTSGNSGATWNTTSRRSN